mgnify:CR=1 FL=1
MPYHTKSLGLLTRLKEPLTPDLIAIIQDNTNLKVGHDRLTVVQQYADDHSPVEIVGMDDVKRFVDECKGAGLPVTIEDVQISLFRHQSLKKKRA